MVDKVNEAAMKAGEATVDPNDFFKAMDANKDNVVDRTEANELAAYMTAATRKQQAQPKAAKSGAAKGGASTGEQDYAAAMFASMDANKDGQLTRQEMQGLLEAANEHNKQQVSLRAHGARTRTQSLQPAGSLVEPGPSPSSEQRRADVCKIV